MLLAETRSTTYTLEGGILVSTLNGNRSMSIMDAAENLEARKKLNVDFPLPFLMDIRKVSDITLEAIIATGNQPDRENYSAAAMLVSETVHELIARESKRFKTSDIPYRIFKSKARAIDWLRSFLDAVIV